MIHRDAGLPLSLQDDKKGLLGPCATSHDHRRRRLPHGLALLTFAFLVSATCSQYWRWLWPSKAATTGVDLPEDMQQAWAVYSPYFAAAEYEPPPAHCNVVQVNLLQRHGARFPTAEGTVLTKRPLEKLLGKAYTRPEYRFLDNFEWDLGAEKLIPLGEEEAFDSGRQHYLRYEGLGDAENLPFIRSSASGRVVSSAENWADGFSTASRREFSPILSRIIPRSENLLSSPRCTGPIGGEAIEEAWLDQFAPPIRDRMNGADLTNQDVAGLMPLCAFESLFHETPSPFCFLFSKEEWEAHEYYADLLRYYRLGYGNLPSRVRGIGYVKELVARLTGHPIGGAQINQTFDSPPDNFPLDRTFYADFSHDDQMITIYTTIGLFRPLEPLPANPDPERTFRLSRMTPFAARMVTEKLKCDDEDEEYVRILVNDAVQPLEFCDANEHHMCKLSDFEASQGYAMDDANNEDDWEACGIPR